MKAKVVSGLLLAAAMANVMAPSLRPTPAAAHSPANYYFARWRGDLSINWRFAPSFPGPGNKRERMEEAFAEWNQVDGAAMRFVKKDAATDGYDPSNPCADDANYNGVFERDNIQFGRVYSCKQPRDNLVRFALVMEENHNWDTGAGDGGTNNYKAVATHEAGHATGFGVGDLTYVHFPEASDSDGVCWDDETFHTMCEGLIPAPFKMTSLEWHDKETFKDTY